MQKKMLMDLNDDNHLCLRCGKTIEGLDNYVSHRQKQCYLYHQPSPLLSDTSKHSSTKSLTEGINSENSYPEIYKPSADDFFLSLNLQSKNENSYSISSDNSKHENNTNENLCSRLNITPLDNDLVNAFGDKEDLCSDIMVNESNNIIIDGIVLSSEKWDSNFKIHTSDSHLSQKDGTVSNFIPEDGVLEMDSVFEINSLCSETGAFKDHVCLEPLVTENKLNEENSKLTKKGSSNNSKSLVLQTSGVSLRKKLHTNCISLCGDTKNYFSCICGHKYGFFLNYFNHLLVCNQRQSDFNRWMLEVFKLEQYIVHSLQFKCQLCLFYCCDCFVFLEHLTSAIHCQNAAGIKNQLICLPCQDECTTNEEVVQHFSETHLKKKSEHPVIISEMKSNLHCCYCLSFLKSISQVQPHANNDFLFKYDIHFLKKNFFTVSSCSYGINKVLLNSCHKLINVHVNSSKEELSKNSSNIGQNCYNGYEQINKTNSSLSNNKKSNNFKNKKKISNLSKKVSGAQNVKIKDYMCENYIKNSLDIPAEQNPKDNNLKIVNKIQKFSSKKNIPSVQKYSCDKCNFQYLSKLSLKRHMSFHCSDNQKVCHLATVCNSNIKNNLYLCDKCGYTGKTVHQLTKHKRSHSGERPFKCNECNYSCSLSSQLSRHKRLHTGFKPYKCPHCSYTCNAQENLRKHILNTKKHKGKKMYSCLHCDFASNIFFDYKNHLLNLHSEHFTNGNKDIMSSKVAGIYHKCLE